MFSKSRNKPTWVKCFTVLLHSSPSSFILLIFLPSFSSFTSNTFLHSLRSSSLNILMLMSNYCNIQCSLYLRSLSSSATYFQGQREINCLIWWSVLWCTLENLWLPLVTSSHFPCSESGSVTKRSTLELGWDFLCDCADSCCVETRPHIQQLRIGV